MHDWMSAQLHDPAGEPPHVVACSSDPERNLLLRSSFHLIEVEVQQVETVEEACHGAAARPPNLIVLDGSVGASHREQARLCREAARCDAPILGLAHADATGVESADLTLYPDVEPYDVLSAVAVLAPELYDEEPQPVELSLEERLLLQSHDLHRLIRDQQEELRELQLANWREAARSLIDVLALRDIETFEHSVRVGRYARALTEVVQPELLDDPSVKLAFLLHDVGKLGIPDRILLKEGSLTPEEMKQMQTHALFGEQILSGLLPPHSIGSAILRSHHERWDGTGYPDGLAGAAIPVGARIFAVADALDALSSDRPYRRARSWQEALATINDGAGTHFDPVVVRALEEIAGDLESVRAQPEPDAV
jgi:putative two-component system response regulator